MPIDSSVQLANSVVVYQPELVNLYGCVIGEHTTVGPFVEIQRDVSIGARCKICSHTFICSGVTIEDEVFVGHGVMFVNDLMPRATTHDGRLETAMDWTLVPTLVSRGASLGSHATILGGVTIATRAMVGAGAVVTRDVAAYAVVVGNPARVMGDVRTVRRDLGRGAPEAGSA
jgi:UDP-2-acetamido-3-amino-2,3-dideoxy-glucuronate N-acetyltransferase